MGFFDNGFVNNTTHTGDQIINLTLTTAYHVAVSNPYFKSDNFPRILVSIPASSTVYSFQEYI